MATILPQSNARLRKITAPGFSEDSDLPATSGTVKWQGNVAAYFKEQVVTSTAQISGAGRVDLLRKTYIVIPTDLLPITEVTNNDVVEFLVGTAVKTRKVRDISSVPSLAAVQGTTRLYLEDT